ncbi:hypothetical protein Tco_0999075 [Tanacetum coccineum]
MVIINYSTLNSSQNGDTYSKAYDLMVAMWHIARMKISCLSKARRNLLLLAGNFKRTQRRETVVTGDGEERKEREKRDKNESSLKAKEVFLFKYKIQKKEFQFSRDGMPR